MYVRDRGTARHMKGRQVALTMYLPPAKYWLLKSLSNKSGLSMQHLLRSALDDVLANQHRNAGRYR